MKKLLFLLKKDLLLAGQYKYVCIFLMIVLSFLQAVPSKGSVDTAIYLFLAMEFGIFSFLSQVLLVENKGKGNLYLAATPYSKKMLVLEKYLVVILIVLIGTGLFLGLITVNAGGLFNNSRLSVNGGIIAASMVFFIYDIFLPLSFRFQYDKVKIVLNVLSAFVPVWGVVLFSHITGGQSFVNQEIYNAWGVTGSIVMIAIDLFLMGISILFSWALFENRDF